MSEKIKPHHVQRKAILYIRQSSTFQVLHNPESGRLQYGMEERLKQLGWREIEVIDDDLGRSAAGMVARHGFERMVADVCLGKVGAVAAREVSRFARNSREWQQLVEMCRVVDTLLIDQDTVYAPRLSNDRLLLGLKGSLNEYELDLLRARSVEARHEKARRGELLVAAPVGFLKTDSQRLEKDPDRRVQEAIRLAFRKCRELGSVRQALLWFLEEGLLFPSRQRGGTTVWKRPSYPALYRVLTHPAYGGAYGYGKSEVTVHYQEGSPRRRSRRKPQSEWLSLRPQAHEGYIGWEEFQQLQRMIAANLQGRGSPGAPKRGQALLCGLLRCRRCGRKLTVHYTGCAHRVLRYGCLRGRLDQGEPTCITFGGILVDEAVEREVIRVVQPAAVEAAVLAAQQTAQQHDEVRAALERDLEAARYEALRARKQYDAVDPENRLVADELERRWNQALVRVRELEQRIEEQHGGGAGEALTTVAEFNGLAADLEAIWNGSATDVRLKKRIVRALIHEVVADVDAAAGEIILVIHWRGGVHTKLHVPRRRRGQNCLHTSKDIVAAVRQLVRIANDKQIAGILNRNGLRTGRSNRWTRMRVTSLRSKHDIPCHDPERRRSEGWLTLTEAARFLGVSTRTLRQATERGTIVGEHPLDDGPWIFNRQALETEAARQVVERARSRNTDPAVPKPGQQNFDFFGK
jgi:DNA invertase Pin-like site-specific DNA recombinase